MNEGYLRQRRNLISISIVLLLMILGGTKANPLFPLNLERPFVAELFAWIGFGYFWYRVKIYGPNNLARQFKNEIILKYVIEYDPGHYTHFNLSTFVGAIDVERKDNARTIFTFIGVTEAVGNAAPGKISIPLNSKEILSKKNYLKNLFSGKVITDFYLPNLIALVVLLLGIYKYRTFFPDIYFYIAIILLFGNAYFLLKTADKKY